MTRSILKFSSPGSVVRDSRVDEDEDNYVFPNVITLDEEAYEDFMNNVKNPPAPTPALVAIFKR